MGRRRCSVGAVDVSERAHTHTGARKHQVAKIGNPPVEDQKHVSEKAKTFLAGKTLLPVACIRYHKTLLPKHKTLLPVASDLLSLSEKPKTFLGGAARLTVTRSRLSAERVPSVCRCRVGAY